MVRRQNDRAFLNRCFNLHDNRFTGKAPERFPIALTRCLDSAFQLD